jgi:hypothetical protein
MVSNNRNRRFLAGFAHNQCMSNSIWDTASKMGSWHCTRSLVTTVNRTKMRMAQHRLLPCRSDRHDTWPQKVPTIPSISKLRFWVVTIMRNFRTHKRLTKPRVRKFDDGALAQKGRARLYSQFLAEYGIAQSYTLSADCTASADYFSLTSYTPYINC